MKTLSKILFTMITTLTFSTSVSAGGLKIKVYNPGSEAIFPVTSTIIYGEKDAVLIDVQFQKQYVLELIKEIKATGKNLKTVYISHSDPDYYFGLDEIKKAFPNAEIVSTAQTAYLINTSKDEKLAVWGGQLKTDAPSGIIVPKAITALPDLEGNKLEIITTPNDPAHTFVWIPSLKTIVGGISISVGSHLWTADSKNYQALDNWMAQIDKMKSLNPEKIIPSHFVVLDESPKNLDWIKTYLTDYKTSAKTSLNAEEMITKMESKYPKLSGKESLEMGAKVFKGEMEWDLKSPFPPIGKHALVDFGGDYKFDLDYVNDKQMRFTGTTGTQKGLTELVNYTVVEVSDNVFMIYWSEPITTKANVVHVQNWNTGTVYTNIANPDGTFVNLKGTIKLVE